MAELSAVDSDRYNILFIFTDDHATNGISAYGGRFASPNPKPVIACSTVKIK